MRHPHRFPLAPLLWPPLALLTAFCAGMAIAAQGGRVNATLDILTHFAPAWLAGSAVTLAAAFLFRGGLRWGIAIPALLGLVAAADLMAPEFLRSTGPHAPADAPGQIKIVQMNAWHENPDPEAILAWLDKERPDIVVIEENSWALRAALARRPQWHVGCADCEVMMLSRVPALSVGRPPRRGWLHLGPITRGYFQDAHGVFPVIGVHHAWPTDVADQQYQEQRLSAYIAETGRERLIVAGDFNSTPWSFSRRRWDRAFGLTRRERALFSWPARLSDMMGELGLPVPPLLAIDHVYAGPGWATVSVRRGPRLSSDHYPVVLTLAPVMPGSGTPRPSPSPPRG